MNKILILLIIGLTITNLGFSQSGLKKLGDEICNEIAEIDISKKNKAELKTIATEVMDKISLKNTETIGNLKLELIEKYPTANKNEINEKVQTKLLFHLFDTCEKYLEMTMKFSQLKTYPNKKSLENIGDDFCSYLDEYKASSYKKLENVIYDKMFSFIIKHESQVKKDYENGKDNQDFIDDIVTYLMSNCGMYYKSTMYSLSNGAE